MSHYEIFEDLLRRIPADMDADQTIALRTLDGRTFVMENRYVRDADYSDEDTFLHSIAAQGVTVVTHLVCLWAEGCVDVPSMHFREGLLALSPENANTLLLLRDDEHIADWPLRRTMPENLSNRTARCCPHINRKER